MATPSTPSRSSAKRTDIPQTPRQRKDAASSRLQGIKTSLPSHLSKDSIRFELVKALDLKFQPDDWQTSLIHNVLKGYDSVVLAGTGYGKSLLFEGLSIMSNLKSTTRKLVIVICPLKALERDQAKQANDKGIEALVINEDTERTVGLWKQARTTAQMVYISPEMAQSESFETLWKDSKFRGRLTAVIIDEAHCVDEWGEDDFRPLYRSLSSLRVFTGMEIPFLACTATCQTATFDLLWSTLGYGSRPFWGVDVGCDRPNLFFQVRPQIHAAPILDVLDILPQSISASTRPEDVDKSLLYMDSETGTRDLIDAIRKVLPAHLRQCVQAFSSGSSETMKARLWEDFTSGKIRILVATDAAGMGCNIPDVKYVIILGIPKSFVVIAQRWGRGGRDRVTQAVCIALVPDWAFEPAMGLSAAAVQLLRGNKPEPKSWAGKRANIEGVLLEFINLGRRGRKACGHEFFRATFRPRTRGLVERKSLTADPPSVTEVRQSGSAYEMTWTVLDLNRVPPASRCCFLCNSEINKLFKAADASDPRLVTYAADFLYPHTIPTVDDSPPPSRRSSISSTASIDSLYEPVDVKMTDEVTSALRVRLEEWRDQKHRARGGSTLLSASVFFPPKQINQVIAAAPKLAKKKEITVKHLRAAVKWDGASDDDIRAIIIQLCLWRDSQRPPATPQSQRRPHKRLRTTPTVGRLAQPVFGPLNNTPRQPAPVAGDDPFAIDTDASLTPRPRPQRRLLPRPQAPPSSVSSFPSSPFSSPVPSVSTGWTPIAPPSTYQMATPGSSFGVMRLDGRSTPRAPSTSRAPHSEPHATAGPSSYPGHALYPPPMPSQFSPTISTPSRGGFQHHAVMYPLPPPSQYGHYLPYPYYSNTFSARPNQPSHSSQLSQQLHIPYNPPSSPQ